MTKPKTAFELYLQDNPSQALATNTNPVTFFEPNTRRLDMADFRPQQVPASGPDPEGYNDFIQPDGAMVPKGWSATVSAPISLESPPEAGVTSAPAEKDQNQGPPPQAQPTATAPVPTAPPVPPAGRKATASRT